MMAGRRAATASMAWGFDRAAFRVLHQVEGREVRQIDAMMIDQARLHTAVGEEDRAAELRQIVSVFGHLISPLLLTTE